MALVIDILSWLLIVGGGFFVIAGGIGVLRFPDVYSRMHAAGLTDTLGAALMLFGLMLQAGPTMVTVKLIIILVFLWFTSPTSSYALANAALLAGLKPVLGDEPAADEKEDRP